MPKSTYTLHQLYNKHKYLEISDGNAIKVCAGCGSWTVDLDRSTGGWKPDAPIALLPKDFGSKGVFNLRAVMQLLSMELKLSLDRYLKEAGFGPRDVKCRQELEALIKEAAV